MARCRGRCRWHHRRDGASRRRCLAETVPREDARPVLWTARAGALSPIQKSTALVAGACRSRAQPARNTTTARTRVWRWRVNWAPACVRTRARHRPSTARTAGDEGGAGRACCCSVRKRPPGTAAATAVASHTSCRDARQSCLPPVAHAMAWFQTACHVPEARGRSQPGPQEARGWLNACCHWGAAGPGTSCKLDARCTRTRALPTGVERANGTAAAP